MEEGEAKEDKENKNDDRENCCKVEYFFEFVFQQNHCRITIEITSTYTLQDRNSNFCNHSIIWQF